MKISSVLVRSLCVFYSIQVTVACSVEAPQIPVVPPSQQLQPDETRWLSRSIDQVGASIAAYSMIQQFAAKQTGNSIQTPAFDSHSMRQLTSRFEPKFELLDSGEANTRTAAATVDISAATLGLSDLNQRLLIEVQGQFRQVEGMTEVLELTGSIRWIGSNSQEKFEVLFSSKSEYLLESLTIEISPCQLNQLLGANPESEGSETQDCGSGKFSGRFADGILSLTATDLQMPLGAYSLHIAQLSCIWNIGGDADLALDISADIYRGERNVGFIRGSHSGNGNSSIEAKFSDELN